MDWHELISKPILTNSDCRVL